MKRMMAMTVMAALAGGAVLTGSLYSGGQAVAAPSAAADGAFTVDAVHSAAIYRIKHLQTSYSYGRFNDISGSFLLDAAKPEASSINVTIKVASIDTGNSKRDDHLKSQDFFSAKEFPTMTFKSTSVKKAGDHSFDVTGDLTIHGQTKPVTAKVEATGQGPGMGGGEIAGLETRFEIKRSDFGMNFMVGKGASDEVTIIVSLEGGRK